MVVLVLLATASCFYLFRADAVSTLKVESAGNVSNSGAAGKKMAASSLAKQQGEEETRILDLGKFRFASGWGKESEPGLRAFSAWTQRYIKAAPTERLVLEKEGVVLAKARRKVFGELIRKQPKLALAETVRAVILQALPESITTLLEERVTGRGDLLVLGRTAPWKVPAISRRATIGDRTFEAFVFGDRLSQKTTRWISMHGVALDGAMAVSESPLRAFEEGEPVPLEKPLAAESCVVSRQPTAPTPAGPRPNSVAAESADKVYWLCRGGHLVEAAEGVAAQESATAALTYGASGDRSVLVIMVDFPDLPGGAATATTALNSINLVATFIQNNAYGQVNFPTRTVTTLLRMPRNSSFYSNPDEINGDTYLLDDARQAARRAGYESMNFDFDIVAFADINFSWSGQGYVGDRGAWVQGDFPTGTTAHELGHNLGLWHANSWISSSATPSSSGRHDEYGNVFDVMGRSSNFPNNHYSANFKYLLGWLPLSNIETVTSSGTYRIYAHDQNSKLDGRKYAVRIPVGLVAGGEVEDYWIDFRQALKTRYPDTMAGAIIQWGNDAGTQSASRLLDTTPQTASIEDAPLALGQTLNDLDNNLQVTLLQRSGEGADAFLDLKIDLSLPPVIDLDQALDTVDLEWTTSPNGWTGVRSITHDGSDAAASGPTVDMGRNYVETTVIGPGGISFWWKASSEANFDVLHFISEGQTNASISGQTDWVFHTFEVTDGIHTFRWTYDKDGSATEGADRVWLDQVVFATGDRPPQINIHPKSMMVSVADTATFRVDAGGSSPLFYFWMRDDKLMEGVTNIALALTNIQFADTGKYSVIVSNAFGIATSNPAMLTVQQTVPLAEAVDYASVSWSSGGAASWRGQEAVSHDGVDAVQSGAVMDGRESSLATTFVGPGTLSFWWKVSSEELYDDLLLYLDSNLVEKHSGEFEWTKKTMIIPNGSHQVRWVYSKDSTVSRGVDAAWVDEVVYDDTPNMPPAVISPPRNQEVSLGGTAVFTGEFLGSEPMEFQWYRNDEALVDGPNVIGARSGRLTVSSVEEDADYRVEVKNSFGEDRSLAASLVIVPLSLGDSLEQSIRPWITGGAGVWSGGTMVFHDGVDAAESARIANEQEVWFETTAIGPGSISFWWQVESERNYDFLMFSIDGSTISSISGLRDWEPYQADFTVGEHKLRWTYRKDANTSNYRDAGWVDQVQITSTRIEPRIENLRMETGAVTGTITPLIAFSGEVVLEASVDLRTWTPVWTRLINNDRIKFRHDTSGASRYLRVKIP